MPATSPRPDPADAVARIALRIGATPMAHVDVASMLSDVCTALPAALGVAGAALVLTGPADPRDPAAPAVFASDEASGRLGLIQQRTGRGPVPAAVRGDRPLVVPDLTVSGPPELAAAAADCGLVRSLVVPVPGAGGLQLLAGADAALDESTAEVLRPLVVALGARLADVREIARLRLDAERAGRAGHDAAAPTAGDPEGGTEELAAGNATPGDPDHANPADGGPAHWDPAEQVPAEQVPAEWVPAERVPAERVPAELVPAEWDPVDDAVDQPTVRLNIVPPDGARPGNGLFADGEPDPDTPPIGQAGLGWDDPEHTPAPTPLPVRPLPARIRVVGRPPRHVPVRSSIPETEAPAPWTAQETAAVPAQRTGPGTGADVGHVTVPAVTAATPVTMADARADDPDEPTGRVPRHRLREDG